MEVNSDRIKGRMSGKILFTMPEDNLTKKYRFSNLYTNVGIVYKIIIPETLQIFRSIGELFTKVYCSYNIIEYNRINVND